MRRGARLLVLSLLIASCSVVLAQTPTIELARLTEFNANDPDVAVDGPTHIVYRQWQGGCFGPPCEYDIYYGRFTNQDPTTLTTVQLETTPTESWAPAIAVSGGIIHVVWQEDDCCDPLELFYVRSTDGGNTFSAPFLLPGMGYYPDIVADGNNVHIVFQNNIDPGSNAALMRSTDAGLSWSTAVDLETSPQNSWLPHIVSEGGDLHVVYRHREFVSIPGLGTPFSVVHTRSSDNGLTWTTPLVVGSGHTRGFNGGWNTGLAVDGPVVHVSWYSSTGLDVGNDPIHDVFYTRSLNNGASFGPATQITTGAPQDYSLPTLVADNGRVHMVYRESSGCFPDCPILYRTSADGGVTFSSEVFVQDQNNTVAVPVAGDENAVQAVWSNRPDDVSMLPPANPISLFYANIVLDDGDPCPLDLLTDMIQLVMSINLHHGIANSLDAKLDAAFNALDDANVNNDGSAINVLNAFINAVEAQRDKKISSSEADLLIAAAQEIIDILITDGLSNCP